MSQTAKWAVLASLLAPLLGIIMVVAFVGVIVQAGRDDCGVGGAGAAAVVDTSNIGEVPGFSGEQLANAATIRQAALDSFPDPALGERAALLGINAALGESTLINIGFGDTVGPDSTGLFQQRDPWAPRAIRMDPLQAARMFFTGGLGGQPGLNSITGWETLPATEAIHRVQRNADPFHYAKYEADAALVYEAVSGLAAGQATAVGGGQCAPGTPVQAAGPGGWIIPAVGTFTSGFGQRGGRLHAGVDIAGPLGTSIVAAGDGVVAGVCTGNRPPCSGYGSLITIDHGGGVVTRYAHMRADRILVPLGQQVTGGTPIAEIGNEGQSTGPHLHFELRVNDQPTDPEPFFSQRGVALAG